jgi:anti-sigma B factor antagonist
MPKSSESKEKVAVVRPMGRMMGPPETTRFHKRVKGHIERDNPWVVVDLGNVDWFNSKAIGTLVSCLTSCRNAGGDLVVARPGKKVLSIFMVSQVVKLFDTYETVKEAKEFLLARKLESGA